MRNSIFSKRIHPVCNFTRWCSFATSSNAQRVQIFKIRRSQMESKFIQKVFVIADPLQFICMSKSQNLLVLEPKFLKTVNSCFCNPQKHEKNFAQPQQNSAHTFPEIQCIFNARKLNLFLKSIKKSHLKYIGFLGKYVPRSLETGQNFFRVSEGYRNKNSQFLENNLHNLMRFCQSQNS